MVLSGLVCTRREKMATPEELSSAADSFDESNSVSSTTSFRSSFTSFRSSCTSLSLTMDSNSERVEVFKTRSRKRNNSQTAKRVKIPKEKITSYQPQVTFSGSSWNRKKYLWSWGRRCWGRTENKGRLLIRKSTLRYVQHRQVTRMKWTIKYVCFWWRERFIWWWALLLVVIYINYVWWWNFKWAWRHWKYAGRS